MLFTKPSCGDFLDKAGQTGPVMDTCNGEYVVWGLRCLSGAGSYEGGVAWGGGGGAGSGEAEEIQEDASNVADWHELPPKLWWPPVSFPSTCVKI